MWVNDIIDRIKLPFRKEKELFSSLYQILGFYPHNIALYKQALLHKSVGRRNDKGKPLNNERLEFLGDAILDAVVGDIVFRHFEGKREGFLTNTRSKLVSRESLGKLAQEMGIVELIQSNGPQRSHNSYMAGNAFEALVGAIYLDQGYDAVMRFMKKRILAQMVNIDKVAYKEVNFKSKLIEWTQKNRVRMDFRTLDAGKDDKGSPTFGVAVVIEGVDGGRGQGYSKKQAQQVAAKETLQRLRREPQFIDAIFQAKSERTKMEEEPTAAAPNLEAEKTDFIIAQEHPETIDEVKAEKQARRRRRSDDVAAEAAAPQPAKSEQVEAEIDELSLEDITHNKAEQDREDIIAAAEAAAFAE